MRSKNGLLSLVRIWHRRDKITRYDWLLDLRYNTYPRNAALKKVPPLSYPDVRKQGKQTLILSSAGLFSSQTHDQVITGRGGAGNVRAIPLKLDVTKMSHPQTASILAQHEAANIEYEREVLKRNREIKANTPVSHLRPHSSGVS